jgi:molybdate transport system substrate-binding protein
LQRFVSFLAIAVLGLPVSSTGASPPPITVFAAASLTDVLQQIGVDYTQQTDRPVRFSFAASSTLARQIESGAPADVFVSADQEWMDYLAQRRLIATNTRHNIVANSLVLVEPVGASNHQLTLDRGLDFGKLLGKTGRLATGDPDTVPVGRYARQALLYLGAWKLVSQRLVPTDNVRTALNFVARGEAALGIVYATDALSEKRVRVVGQFPVDSHRPIRYPAAAVTGSTSAAADFVRFLAQSRAQNLFKRAGFLPVESGKASALTDNWHPLAVPTHTGTKN